MTIKQQRLQILEAKLVQLDDIMDTLADQQAELLKAKEQVEQEDSDA